MKPSSSEGDGAREPGPMKPPGARASTVHGYRIWDDLFSCLCRVRCKLALCLHSAFTKPAQERAPKGQAWPMPLPFPELHRKGARRTQVDSARKLAINFIVLCMDFLFAGESHYGIVVPGLGTRLNQVQWGFVRGLTGLVDEWNSSVPISPEVMGQSAAKFENVEDVLRHLVSESCKVAKDLKSYAGFTGRDLQTDWGNRHSPGEVVGRSGHVLEHVAKAIQPSRLKFWQRPTFDPSPYLDYANRASYLRPYDFCIDEELCQPAPRVRVRIRLEDKLGFINLLASTGRLALRPAACVREGLDCGAFAIPKDASRDRMVLDARPANTREHSERRWIRSLASVSQLLHWFLAPNETVRLFAEDLTKFYHAFVVSEQRLLRNSLKMRFPLDEVRHLLTDDEVEQWRGQILSPCLATMAMGDLNAVAYGQTSHLGVLLQNNCLKLNNLITLTGRPSRGDWLAGLMIDDFVVLEKRKREDHSTEETSEAEQVVRDVRQAYEKVQLPRHEGKSVYAAEEGSFWGVQLNGSEGYLRPNLSRAIPLASIIRQVVSLGYATVSLLELLAGSLVSIFQLRRRFMSVLQEVYGAQRGRDRASIVLLSPELKDELLVCIPLIALTQVDMRLAPSDKLVASDASSQKEAAAFVQVGSVATMEFQRHALQKGLWSKLLTPEAALRRERGDLAAAEELPEGPYDFHPIWQEVTETMQLRPLGKVKKIRRRRHINIGEVEAALSAEEEMGKIQKNSFYVHLQDSQVSLAALVKGRSSSRSLNSPIKCSIPNHVLYNTRPFYGYVETSRNVADDPTRDRPLRPPVREKASWLAGALAGDFRQMDAMLEEHNMHTEQLKGLPEEEELLESWGCDGLQCSDVRAQRRKVQRSRKKEKMKSVAAEEVGGLSLQPEETVEKEQKGSDAETIKAEKDLGTRVQHPGLSEDVVNELLELREDQFVFSKRFASLREALSSGPGFLDLFSGSRGVARNLVRRAPCWVLCFDLSHHPSENLRLNSVQQRIVSLVDRGAFLAMGGGPECRSFSTAVTPPCRNKENPAGVPWASDSERENEIWERAVAVCPKAGRASYRPKYEILDREPRFFVVLETSASSVLGCHFGSSWRRRRPV